MSNKEKTEEKITRGIILKKSRQNFEVFLKKYKGTKENIQR